VKKRDEGEQLKERLEREKSGLIGLLGKSDSPLKGEWLREQIGLRSEKPTYDELLRYAAALAVLDRAVFRKMGKSAEKLRANALSDSGRKAAKERHARDKAKKDAVIAIYLVNSKRWKGKSHAATCLFKLFATENKKGKKTPSKKTIEEVWLSPKSITNWLTEK
jgi:hypothetical protein